MKDLIQRTRALFMDGAPLEAMVAPSLRVDLELFRRGGCGVLDAIERIGYDTLHYRPEFNRWSKAALLSRAIAAKLWRAATGRRVARPVVDLAAAPAASRAAAPVADSTGSKKGSYAERRA
jgi:hypothetical protein